MFPIQVIFVNYLIFVNIHVELYWRIGLLRFLEHISEGALRVFCLSWVTKF